MEAAKANLSSLSASRPALTEIGVLLVEPAKLQSGGLLSGGVLLDEQLLRWLVDSIT